MKSAYLQVRAAGAYGLPISHISDDVADSLLALGAIWQDGEVYYASAETGDAPTIPTPPGP